MIVDGRGWIEADGKLFSIRNLDLRIAGLGWEVVGSNYLVLSLNVG